MIDADDAPPPIERLGATVRGGVTPAIVATPGSLRALLERFIDGPDPLPEDAVRRLGVVLVVAPAADGRPRVEAAHYLRPAERDAGGHLQRRPPAILATWDPVLEAWEGFAWGIAGELGDRIDRSARDLEDRQASRADALARFARLPAADHPSAMAMLVAAEPPREHAPSEPPAYPRAPRSALTDPHRH